MIVRAKLVRGTTYTISFGIDCFLPPCGLHSFFFPFFFFFIQSPYYGGRGRKISNFFFRFEPENVLNTFLKLCGIVFQEISLDATRLSSTSN